MTDLQKFYKLLNHYSELVPYWDIESNRVDIRAINSAYLSDEMSIVKDILLSIWEGRSNVIKMDITDIAILSPDFKKPILEWFWMPFFP